MRNKLLTLLLAAVMLISPAAVFADTTADPAGDDNAVAFQEELGETDGTTVSDESAFDGEIGDVEDPGSQSEGWNADRTEYRKDGQLQTGLFKAPCLQSEEVLRLYYADDSGKVVKQTGIITVSGDRKRYYYDTQLDGFTPVTDPEDTNDYTYFILNQDGDNYIVSTQGLYTDDNNNTYLVDSEGHVKMTNGFATFKDSDAKDVKVYVRKDGTVRTDAGWLFVDNDKYRVMKGGAIYTKAGVMTYDGDKYIVYESGKIRRKTGVYKLKSGVRYYVLYTSGKLAKYKSIKNKKTGRIYHVASDCHVIIGRHQWKNKKYYFSNEYGYLSTIKRIEKNKTGSYFVKKGGLIAVNTKVSYKGKSYIAGKYGYFKTGLFKWNKRYYYASKTGVLRVKKGKFAYEGYIYYVGSGGVIHSNGLFTESGKKYLANEKGHLQKGLIKWKGKIYYADDNYVIRTKEQILKYNNKFYYIQSGGAIASNRFVTYNGKHYYAKSDGSFYTTKFTYAGVTIKPSKTGVISDSDYKKIFPNG